MRWPRSPCAASAAFVLRKLPELGRFPIILMLLARRIVSGLMQWRAHADDRDRPQMGLFRRSSCWRVLDCIRAMATPASCGLLLWAFAPPLVYQALSIGLGVGKATESDGSISYIGGYNHEAAFSIVLVTCFAVASLAPRLNPVVRLGLLVACLAGILAANYRTSLIAIAPIAFGYFVFGAARSASPGRRILISLVGLIVMAGGFVAANVAAAERLNDVAIAAGETGRSDPVARRVHRG